MKNLTQITFETTVTRKRTIIVEGVIMGKIKDRAWNHLQERQKKGDEDYDGWTREDSDMVCESLLKYEVESWIMDGGFEEFIENLNEKSYEAIAEKISEVEERPDGRGTIFVDSITMNPCSSCGSTRIEISSTGSESWGECLDCEKCGPDVDDDFTGIGSLVTERIMELWNKENPKPA